VGFLLANTNVSAWSFNRYSRRAADFTLINIEKEETAGEQKCDEN
jgi:hypothetical protein